MLPTTGFFKDIDCPYYETSCDRPYCHFRHRKRSQERADENEASSQACEVPTYKPTPKSQLANTKSHIPISYVPDLVIRADRNFRIPSTYNYSEKPTYKPTPLSELSKTNRQNNADNNVINKSNELNSDVSSSRKDEPENENEQNIDFEDLSMEFDMIDEIINDCKESGNNKKRKEESTSSSSKPHKRSTTKHDKSNSSRKDKQRESTKSSKSRKSEHKHDEKSSSKYRHDYKKEHKSEKNRKTEEKHKSKTRSDDKHSHKSRHRDKERDKERYKEKEKHKHKDENKKSEQHKKRSNSKSKQHENKQEVKDEPSEEDVPDPIIYSDNDSEDLNDPSLEEECYRIFNEYKPEPVEKPTSKTIETVEEYIPTPKKRIAYHNAEQCTSKISFTKHKPLPNAALTMANRIKLARIAQENREESAHTDSNSKGIKRPSISDEHDETKKLLSTLTGYSCNVKTKTKPQSQSSVNDVFNAKMKSRRIAPVQNVNCIQQAKARIEEITRKKAASMINKTPIQTLGKGTKRVAHVPDLSLADIPDVLQPENKKIPLNIRTRYLTMMANECAKLYLIKEEAYERALNEELKVLERCAAITTYRNSAMLAINRIRKEVQERESQGLGPILCDEVAMNSSSSQYNGKKFYDSILTYILTEEELELHGYPREGPVPGRAVISVLKQMPKVNLDSSQRLCCRCFKVYLVDDDGFPLYEEECLYHPLKKRTLRGDRIYLCCKSTEDTGCVTSNTHVCEADESDLEGFQTTMESDQENDSRSHAVYALDCEMCYTTKGLELTRVTIIDADCKTVYESLVKPLNPIIDYNTRFSGITKEQMDKTSTSILQVQANILHLCNSRTILIGHSLESDMKALKIIHSCIIDTSVMFPHRLGLPHKRALRVLASEFLRKIIQSDVAGHDSAEDALTCMELVQWKVKEDLKVRGMK